MRELLEDVLRRAKLSPFYRDRLAHVTAWPKEWNDAPVTTKEDLRAAYPFGLLAVPRERLATYHESSGTSGEPTSTYLTDADWDDIASRFARNAVDLGPSDTVLVKTPYSLVTTAHQMHRAARLRGALVVPADNRSSNMPYAKVVRLLRDVGVTVAWCMPSEALIWAQAAREHGLDPARDFPRFRAFIVAGEALSPARRRRIREAWGGIAVYEDYGSTETGSLAGDCREGRLHAWSDRVHFEVLDEATQRLSESGEGRLVVTPLYREAQPLVRYLIGDYVRLGTERCACGSPLPVIRVLGRPESAVRVGERALLPVDVEEAIHAEPGVIFWRARPEGGVLRVEFEGEDHRADALSRALAERLGVRVDARAVSAGALLPRARLTDPGRFVKPRYFFHEGEPWDAGLLY